MQKTFNLEIEDFELTPNQYILNQKSLYAFMFLPFGALNYEQAVRRIHETNDTLQAERLETAVYEMRTYHAISVLQALHNGEIVPQRVLDCYKSPEEILTALQQNAAPDCLQSAALPCGNG